MTISSEAMDLKIDKKPRHLVYSKMERLMKAMQHPDTGVTVRSQKMFLATIPCAFTGYDLIEWLMVKFHLEEATEALHLASLLCHYGYFFPITDSKNLNVKDDSSLYRFQGPVHWPSQIVDVDNVSYALHLVKRSMRNKQKHGLEDYELAACNKLKKMLCDKWGFINMQAREQVKFIKTKKKTDKVVLDSQERAFWRIHRPPPGHIKCLEEGPKRNFQPSQMAARKKKNKEMLKNEIRYLEKALERPRMKMSKVTDCTIARCEQYYDYDPVLTGALPSIPWITEDVSLWTFNMPFADMLTEMRVKKWSFGIHEAINDPCGQLEFELFLQKEYSQENIRFWKLCQELKFCPESRVKTLAERIYKEFLSPGAPCEVNIDSKTMEMVQRNMASPKRCTFELAQDHIYLLMKKDSYQRFLRSNHYKNLLLNATQPCGKKKFFNFGAGKKKTPNPSPQAKRRGSSTSEKNGDIFDNAGVSTHHSYSTGNLRELDDKAHPFRTGLNGSDSSLTASDPSPNTIRRKLEQLSRTASPHRRSLAVPSTHPILNDHNSADNLSCLALSVPTKLNVVAPWEDSD